MSAFMAVSMLVQTLYLLADLYWVGHLGKEAIAAVGVAGNMTMIVLALTQMLGVGTTTLISQAAGKKDQPHAELAFNQSFMMSILIALALGVCGFLLMNPYCESLSANAETAKLAKSYLLWFIPALALQFPLVTLGSALRATGIIKPTVGLQVLSVLLNISPRAFLDFRLGRAAKTRRDRRGARHFHFHLDRRRADGDLFRKEISLSALSFSTLSSANKDLDKDARYWRAGGR